MLRDERAPGLGELLLCLLCAGHFFSTSLGCGTRPPPPPPWPAIDAPPLSMPDEFPHPGFVAMRSNGHGDIPVFGSCREESALVRARWKGGAWASLGPCSGGKYSGELRGQPTGSGKLEVRSRGQNVRTVIGVGVGDVFVVVGQSNAVGATSSLRGAVHPWASVLSLDPDESLFRHADDPLHLASHWFGSAWPIFMDDVIALTGAPILMIMTAQPATGLVSPDHWRPGGDRFQRAVTNTSVGTGGAMRVTAILHLQGETDAVNEVSYEDYKSALMSLADALVAQLAAPAPVIVAQIGPNSSIPELQLKEIRDAQRDAASENPNILPGPCFADWVGGSNRVHYEDLDAERSDGRGGDAGIVPERWLAAVRHLIGGSPASPLELGCGP